MLNILYNDVLPYGVELLKLVLFCFGIIGIKSLPLKKCLAICALSFIIVIVTRSIFDDEATGFIFGLIAVITSALITQEKKKALLSFLIYIYICILDMIIYGIISSMLTVELEESLANKAIYLFINSLSLLVIIPLMIYSIRKKRVLQEGLTLINVLLLSFGGVALALSLTIALLLFGNNITERYARLAQVCMCIIGLIFIVCARMLISGKMQNKLLKIENSNAWHIMKSQETYYKMLLQREEETRAFRHDIQSHLNCLYSLYKEMKWYEFEKYLEELNNALHDIRKIIETGNKIVNAIVSDIVSKHREVKYTWKGCLPEEFNITPMQVCTIFSNLISNAFEAAEKVENGDVYIEVRNIGTSVRVLISNSSINMPKFENGKYISSKKEEHHGFGISNVIKTLDSLNGSFLMEPLNDRVNVEIIIPGAFEIE